MSISSQTAIADKHDVLNRSSLDSNSLEKAFKLFSEMSEQLSGSYQILEDQVTQLRGELDSVSEQRIVELAEKEKLADRLEGLLNILPGGVIVLDGNGLISETNPAAEALFENLYDAPIKGQQWLKVIKHCFTPRKDDGHEVSLKNNKRISIATRSLESEPGQIILLTDLTETRQLLQQLHRHERLSAMGNMMASLAHQIRTPLSAAMLYGDHLCKGNLSSEQSMQFAHKLMARLAHLEQQIRDLLIFAKGEMPLSDLITVRELVAHITLAMEAPLKSSRSQCSWQVTHSDVWLQCNVDALVGAILNCVNNSIQAVSGNAEIEIHIQSINDDNLQISVIDKGPGIDVDLKERIYDPFVTTKKQGTGLGLSIVLAVARAHHGDFSIESHMKDDNGSTKSCADRTCANFILPYQRNAPLQQDAVVKKEKVNEYK